MPGTQDVQPAMVAHRLSSSSEAAAHGEPAVSGPVASGYLDETAFARLHAAAAGPIRTYFYRVRGDAAQAEDLVQETFLRLLRAKIGGLDEDELRAYAFRVAGNIAVDAWRRKKREGQLIEVAERDATHETAPQ